MVWHFLKGGLPTEVLERDLRAIALTHVDLPGDEHLHLSRGQDVVRTC